MGFASSPYNSIKMALVVEEVVKGNRWETGKGSDGNELNPFQWKAVRLNLPGKASYDPTLPWISKLREDGCIACDLFTFVDDERVTGPNLELVWQAVHRLGSIQSYLGEQDSSRKARQVSQTPGAWAGAVVHVLKQLGVCVLTSEDKWERLRSILEKWAERLERGDVEADHKELISDRGFLVYVTRTYPPMVPHLKGFHLSAEMWRGGRDSEGYKLKPSPAVSPPSDSSVDSLATEADDAAMLHHTRHSATSPMPRAPENGRTPIVPRLREDVDALRRLSDFDRPPLRVVRPSRAVHVFYGFGDASGKQFGSTLSSDYNCRARLGPPSSSPTGITFRLGIWTAREQEESSNYKELANLVEATEAEAEAGHLDHCEYFLFTDNSTTEMCYYKGSSSSRTLHDLVLRLKVLEMRHGMHLHVIHVAGKRMIAQGTDGCSRGSLLEGVMAGRDMLSYVDLDKSAFERFPPLLDWLREWTGEKSLEPLAPEGWFVEGHGIVGGYKDPNGVWIPKHGPKGKTFLWAAPPAVADAMLEELAKARHKRADTFHIVVLPRLMVPRWRRLFNKLCDFDFELTPGHLAWPEHMFEPLWVGVVFPYHRFEPWVLKGTPLLVEKSRALREMHSSGGGDGRDLLRKLWRVPRRLAALPEHLARGVLRLPRAGYISNA